MNHQRSVDPGNRLALRKQLHMALEGAPDEIARSISRAATLNGPEAQRILAMAAHNNDQIDDAQVQKAREIIEKFSVTP